MLPKILKKSIFFILSFLSVLLLCQNAIFGNSNVPEKYFVTLKEAAIKIKPDNISKTIGKLCKDVYVRSLGWNEEWLYVDIEYSNLLADSLDDINIHFTGWVNKNDFEEKSDDLNKTEFGQSSSCSENTTYFPKEDNPGILSDIWNENEKYFPLFCENKSEFFKLPNIVYEKNNVLSSQISFTVISVCRDWSGLDWLEVVYNSPDFGFQNGWIKKIDIINEKEKILQDGIIKKMEEIKEEKIEEIKNIKNEIVQLMNKIDAKVVDSSIITGKKDFDKRIRELEIQTLHKELDEKLERLNIIQGQ